MSLEQLLPQVRDISAAACAAILTVYNSDKFDVEHKADDSPLTQADLAANQVIVNGLSALTPDIPILSEESIAVPFDQRREWQTYWLVDPLDGTKEFIKRNGEFTVNIALIQDHRPVLGVVSVPVRDEHYLAAEGVGCFKQVGAAEPQSIEVREVSGGPLAVVGSRSHAGPELQAYLDRLGEHEIVPMGSSLKFCLIAEGKADLYPRLGPTSEWDTAAAQCVVEQAGGMVTGLNLEPLPYNSKESILNPYFLVFGDPNRDWSAYLS